MPTGYTDCIRKGASFEEFVMGIARAFGANIMMRDDPHDAKIIDYQVSQYYFDRVEEAKAELVTARIMTLEEAARLVKEEYDAEVARIEERLKENETEISRYREMLKKVRAWTPPTEDHQAVKDFMIEQIESSIKHDDMSEYYSRKPERLTAEQYLIQNLSEAEERLARCTRDLAEEIERTNQRNEWNRQLKRSLGL